MLVKVTLNSLQLIIHKHCARKEHGITLWRPAMETPNTVHFSERYMHVRHDATDDSKQNWRGTKQNGKWTRCNQCNYGAYHLPMG